jgi:FkbM family methyltransferase
MKSLGKLGGYGPRIRSLKNGIYRRIRNMALYKKPLVPAYVYAARVREEDVPFFEQQYFKYVDLFDPEVRATPERFEFAKRMGYAFFANIKKSLEQSDPAVLKLGKSVASLGDASYAWSYLPQFINKNSVVYAFGVGTDISFEVQLANKYQCPVYTFDPTPQAVEYAINIARKEPLIKFYPYGVLGRDTMVRFYKPRDVGLGSLSTANLHFGNIYIEAPVMRLITLARQFGHDHIDLLKIDIEGGEYDVIDDMLFCGLPVDQFCVEFDQPSPPWRTERFFGKLHGAGYHLVDVQGLNCLFVHQRLLDKSA